MKKFFRFVVEFKSWLSLCFTASILIFITISWLIGEKTVKISSLFQIFLLAAGITLLQFVFFSGQVIQKMRYSLRLLLFALPALGLVSLCAAGFGWVPRGNAGAWVLFCVIFLVCFALICAGFEFCFWAAGKKYDGLLGQYRSKKEERS